MALKAKKIIVLIDINGIYCEEEGKLDLSSLINRYEVRSMITDGESVVG